jgi:hypothetical protein
MVLSVTPTLAVVEVCGSVVMLPVVAVVPVPEVLTPVEPVLDEDDDEPDVLVVDGVVGSEAPVEPGSAAGALDDAPAGVVLTLVVCTVGTVVGVALGSLAAVVDVGVAGEAALWTRRCTAGAFGLGASALSSGETALA